MLKCEEKNCLVNDIVVIGGLNCFEEISFKNQYYDSQGLCLWVRKDLLTNEIDEILVIMVSWN